jgi:hypothetical protein
MCYLTSLNQRLDRKNSHWLAQAGSGGLECGKASCASGCKFCFERWQGCPIYHCRKGLGETVDRAQGDGSLCDPRMIEEKRNQRGGKQRQIDGQKDCPARGRRSERRADSAQGAQKGFGILDDWGKAGKTRSPAR